jgi:uncharacterized protein (TIGR00369 family)
MAAAEVKAKPPAESSLDLHTLMVPEHSNGYGNVHGGVILRAVDEAGALCAMRHARKPVVTIAIDSMTFRHPVHVGELLICSAKVTWVGRSSIEVHVDVHAEQPVTGAKSHTNSAYVVYVALGANGLASPAPQLELTTDAERADFAAGAARHARRIAER